MLFVNHYSRLITTAGVNQNVYMPRPRAPPPVNSSDMEAVIVARRLPNPVSQGRHSFRPIPRFGVGGVGGAPDSSDH